MRLNDATAVHYWYDILTELLNVACIDCIE